MIEFPCLPRVHVTYTGSAAAVFKPAWNLAVVPAPSSALTGVPRGSQSRACVVWHCVMSADMRVFSSLNLWRWQTDDPDVAGEHFTSIYWRILTGRVPHTASDVTGFPLSCLADATSGRKRWGHTYVCIRFFPLILPYAVKMIRLWIRETGVWMHARF